MRFFYFGGERVREQVLSQKQAQVDEIKEKIEAAKSIVLMNYHGLNVGEVTDLRNKFRAEEVEYKVYKNTLMKRAFTELGYEGLDEVLKGPSSIAFSMADAVPAAKIASEFAKDHEALEIKSGILDGKVISTDMIESLAKLPSREVLIAQVLGGLNAPIQGLANVLSGTIRGLAVVLNAIAEKQRTRSSLMLQIKKIKKYFKNI